MGLFAAGEVILLRYPFSDLSSSKQRPAVVLAAAGRSDWIVCQVTSNPFAEAGSIRLTTEDFLSGGLHHISYARPAKIFTAHESLILGTLGTLQQSTFAQVREAVITIIGGA